MTNFFNRRSEMEVRRELRNNMPRAEVLLWSRLKDRQVAGAKFRRQYSVGPYVVDFCAPRAKLAVEVDGDSHFGAGAKDRDAERQRYIEAFGIRLLRFTNADVYDALEHVVEAITDGLKWVADRPSTTTPPNPPFARGGGEAPAFAKGEGRPPTLARGAGE
jgi:very-short-patch-repair endonuclease